MIYCSYINGSFKPASEAVLPINDLAILRGYAVFDYLRTYGQKPFRLDDHLARLTRSASLLNMTLPLSFDEIKQIIKELIEKSGTTEDVGIRILLTGGPSSDGITFEKPSLFINAENLYRPAADLFENGVKLITQEHLRETPEIKSTNYLNAIKNAQIKKENGAFEILYHWNNCILETSRNNFFIFKDDVLITPDKDVLPGITRKTVLELSRNLFKVEIRKLHLDELKEATEAFITGTTKKVMPVVKVDDLIIGKGAVGKNSKKLLTLFNQFVENSPKINF
jgi:branched-chain amino acid aminotransferase